MSARLSRSGIAVLAVIPWVIAAVGLAVAASGWVAAGDDGPRPSRVAAADPAELRTLRLALANAGAENSALRGELDRLVGSGQAAAARSRAARAPVGSAGEKPPPEDVDELSQRIREALSRAAVGDDESAREGAMAMMKALQNGPGAVEALQKAYLETSDPKARLMMLPTMLFSGGEAAREFVVDQALTETDPELRRSLLSQAAAFATPKYATQLKQGFLDVLQAEQDPELRASAVRGLRYARGDDVQRALVDAMNDPQQEIRLAAIENLASRPATRSQLREMLARDSSPTVREFGECRLLLAESGF